MTFILKQSARIGSLLTLTTLACSSAWAQADRPDLEGIWTNASLTNLTRPTGVESLIVSPEEALAISAVTPIAGLEGGLDEGDGINNTPEAAGDDFGTRAYNNFG